MTTDLERRLHDDLHAVDGAHLDRSIPGRIGTVEQRRERRRRAGIVAACIVLVGAGVIGVAVTGRDEPPPSATTPTVAATVAATTPPATTAPAPTTSTTPSTSAAPSDDAVSAQDPWRAITIADDPRGDVEHPAAVWTGSEIVTVAGVDAFDQDDRSFVDGGAAYDPATDRWRMISGPGALITDDFRPVGTIEVWTGDQMLVLGDNERGARYDPTTDVWNRLQFPFDGDVTADTPHVWTGDEWLVWPDSGPVAYSPSAQKWRELAHPPIAGRSRAASVWSGTEWIVWGGRTVDGDVGGQAADGAAYDPSTDAWRVIADAPLAARWVGGVWAHGEMFVQGGATGPDNGPFAHGDGAAYDPATDTWRSLAPGPAHPGAQVTTSGDQIFAFFKNWVMVYDIATDTWDEAGGIRSGGYTSGPAIWAGDRLVVLGGTAPFAVSAS